MKKVSDMASTCGEWETCIDIDIEEANGIPMGTEDGLWPFSQSMDKTLLYGIPGYAKLHS